MRGFVWSRPDPRCCEFEAALDAAGIPIALVHRDAWSTRFGTGRSLLAGVRDAHGHPVYACGIDVVPTRSIPGHVVHRIERFGDCAHPLAARVALETALAHAMQSKGVLRLEIDGFAATPDRLTHLQHAVAALRFAKGTAPRSYSRTLRLELPASREDLQASFKKTARQNLRTATKLGAEVRPIDDPAMASALSAIEQAAFARTGGRAIPSDFESLVDFCNRQPKLARLVGVFAGSGSEGDGLLGFAIGRAHGDHVEYANAGTVRRPGLKIPLGYPLMLNLMEWAQEIGAQWFDFGGVTSGSTGDRRDALGGISDFKRYFGGTELEVGGEWVLHVRPLRSRLAVGISRLVGTFPGR